MPGRLWQPSAIRAALRSCAALGRGRGCRRRRRGTRGRARRRRRSHRPRRWLRGAGGPIYARGAEARYRGVAGRGGGRSRVRRSRMGRLCGRTGRYFGVYGKLGERKGSFALLAAMHRLKQAGLDVGLVALAHGPPDGAKRFRAQAHGTRPCRPRPPNPVPSPLAGARIPARLPGGLLPRAGLPDRSFTRRSIPREVLLCGTCLVASTEVDPEASRAMNGCPTATDASRSKT